MKPITTLYLLLTDDAYRLLHTAGEGMTELHHTKAALSAAGVAQVTGSSLREGIERVHLAKHASAVLADEWGKGVYDRIVIAAGPKMLGKIRHELPKSLEPYIAAELHTNLINIPLHDLRLHFGTVSAV